MASKLEEQLNLLKSMSNEILQLGPSVVAEAGPHSPDGGAVIQSAFDELGASLASMNERMAGFGKEAESFLVEAGKAVDLTKGRLPTDSAPATSATPLAGSLPDLPGDLAPTYARQLLARYANAPASKQTVDPGDSRVWFDSSLAGVESVIAGRNFPMLRSFLANTSNRIVVWWTCVMLSDVLESEWHKITAESRNAIEAAVEWVLNPTPAAGAALIVRTNAAEKATVPAAIGNLFKSISEHGSGEAAGEKVADAAIETILLTCRRLSAEDSAKLIARAREIAADMKAGKRLWSENAGDSSAAVADSLASFSRWTDG